MQILAGFERAILLHLRPISAIPLRSFRLPPRLSRKRRMPFGCLHCLRRRHRNLRRVHSSSFCSYSRDFPSNFFFHGSLPPRSCFVPAPRALTLTGQTLPCLTNQPYSRRLLCSSGLGFRIIAAPRGLSSQCAYRVGRTKKSLPDTEQRPELHLPKSYFCLFFTSTTCCSPYQC